MTILNIPPMQRIQINRNLTCLPRSQAKWRRCCCDIPSSISYWPQYIRRYSFHEWAKSHRSLLFKQERSTISYFPSQYHKRWQPRIYSQRNSPCLLCYIKLETEKKIGGERKPKHNKNGAVTLKLHFFFRSSSPSVDRMFSCWGLNSVRRKRITPRRTPTCLLPQLLLLVGFALKTGLV